MGEMGVPSCPEGAKPTFPRFASSIFILRNCPALCPFRPSRRPTVNSLTTRDDFLRSDRHCRSSLAQSTSMTYFIARRLCPLHNRSPSVTLRVDSTNYSKTCPYIWISYGKNSFAGPILSKCLFTYSNINIYSIIRNGN